MPKTPDALNGPLIHAGDGGMSVRRHGSGVVAATSLPSPARPESDEDALRVLPVGGDGALLAVADGCGGMPAGDRASAAVVTAFSSAIRETVGSDLTSAVLAGFDRANSAVTDLRVGAGSTLTAVLVVDRVARVIHAGDSPAMVVGQRGAVRFATLSHSLVGFGVTAGLLTADEAQGHEDSGVVLNVLGFPEMFVHVGPPIELKPMDTVLVASDGLSDNVPIEQIVAACRVGTAECALERLAELASHAMVESPAGHADDLSIALYRPTRRRGE
jgi:serine/threonine protein phosphatase PrpC